MVMYGNIKMNNMNNKIEYVNGFLFSPDYKRIVLIRKNRPTFQIGKLNGIGGRIEQDEAPIDAMKREFIEEAGLDVENWHKFSIMEGNDWIVHMYVAISEDYTKTYSNTDEEIEIHYVFDLANLDVIPNLKWLIPLSIDTDNTFTHINYL